MVLRTVSANGREWIGRPIGVKRPNYLSRLFFLQGHPGTGKSTIIEKVLRKLKQRHPTLRIQGFHNRELHLGNAERTPIGLRTISVNGPRRILCSTWPIPDCLTNPPEYLTKYKVDVYGFESIALPELKLKEDTELFVVDEIGHFELLSTEFYPAFLPILNSRIPILGALPHPNFSFNIHEVESIRQRKDLRLYNVYYRNRDMIPDKLFAKLNQLFLYRKEEGNDKKPRNHGVYQYWTPEIEEERKKMFNKVIRV